MQRDLVGKEHPVAALSKQQHFGRVEGGKAFAAPALQQTGLEKALFKNL